MQIATNPSMVAAMIVMARVLVALAFASLAARAQDLTGIWFDPAESGWGLTLAQQGPVTFAVLMHYDQAGRPTWYVASDVRTVPDPFVSAFAPTHYAGTLYRASGPWLGGPFDPRSVTATPVGELRFDFFSHADRTIDVTFTVDGHTVTRTLQPQSWSDDRATLAGNYTGGIAAPTPADFCNLAFAPPANRPWNIRVDLGADDEVRFTWSTGIDTACAIVGKYQRQGQLGQVTGRLECGPVTQPTTVASARVLEIRVDGYGFSGLAGFDTASCAISGAIGGVRQGPS